MQLNPKKTNRLASYCIFDKYGVVDDYVFAYLKDLKKNVKDIIITVNGKLQPEFRTRLEEFGQVFVRKNEGLDVAAHKEAILRVGFDKLAEYDEIILQNDTLFGPVYPLAKTFEKMARMDLDFWGLTKYYHEEPVRKNVHPKGYIPEHINTSFLVCRTSLVNAPEFRKYWKKMPIYKYYMDVVNFHEAVFTKHFENLGFKWSTSVETDQVQKKGLHYPLMQQPLELVEKLRCPVFKRRLFFHEPAGYFAYSVGDAPVKLLKYLQQRTNYNTDLVYKNIIRTLNPYVLTKNLGLFKSLPKHLVKSSAQSVPKQRVALVMHSYFTDLVPYLLKYATNMPEDADIYVTTGSQ
ncbi:MAG: rhamnan synthesis F family protein, partial [Candidatus Ancillula trichonymphae]|nr:rhamnan synthesis F family protein [Candidatus Ancillula trichonymphae]